MNEIKLKDTANKEHINNKLVIVLSILYFIAVIWVVIFKCNIDNHLCVAENRAMPLTERFIFHLKHSTIEATIFSISKGTYIEVFALIFNIVGFIPLGTSFRHFNKKTRAILLSFLMVIGIELFQLFSCVGGLQIGDIILNTLGCYTGIIIYEKYFNKIKPSLINKISIILICAAIPFDIYFIINTINHWPWS